MKFQFIDMAKESISTSTKLLSFSRALKSHQHCSPGSTRSEIMRRNFPRKGRQPGRSACLPSHFEHLTITQMMLTYPLLYERFDMRRRDQADRVTQLGAAGPLRHLRQQWRATLVPVGLLLIGVR